MKAVGAFSRATRKVLASSGLSRAALWLPTPMPSPSSSTASAMAELMRSASPAPPVMAETMRGAANSWPKKRARRSICPYSAAGTAECTSHTCSSHVLTPLASTSRSRHILMWSSLRLSVSPANRGTCAGGGCLPVFNAFRERGPQPRPALSTTGPTRAQVSPGSGRSTTLIDPREGGREG